MCSSPGLARHLTPDGVDSIVSRCEAFEQVLSKGGHLRVKEKRQGGTSAVFVVAAASFKSTSAADVPAARKQAVPAPAGACSPALRP